MTTKYIEIDRAIETALLLLEEGEDEQTLAYNAALVAFIKNMENVPAADVVDVVRCCKCIYWDRDTIRHQGNDFRDWNEAECLVLAERDGYNEINRYTESDDFCSRGERKDG